MVLLRNNKSLCNFHNKIWFLPKNKFQEKTTNDIIAFYDSFNLIMYVIACLGYVLNCSGCDYLYGLLNFELFMIVNYIYLLGFYNKPYCEP